VYDEKYFSEEIGLLVGITTPRPKKGGDEE
jgi:hypothetical protein